ncbi:uncharacterized protein PAC_00286 [Phialocephala subalpina]|uniref:Uncharacterized protein n=1 Tax=Phialocephala subalpina TaxID=576137 RepID=A0A1L7WCA2_9HELO|nr:uncharacterized protein PAC_00286 [Phialocephala subalpina]
MQERIIPPRLLAFSLGSQEVDKIVGSLASHFSFSAKFLLQAFKLDDKYIAGIWGKDMSWASVEGPVQFGYVNEANRSRKPNLCLRFVEWTVVPRGYNAFGEVDSGILRVEGPSLACFMSVGIQGPEPAYELLPLEAGLSHAVISSGMNFDTPLQELEIQQEGGTLNCLNRSNHDNEDAVGGQVLCLLLYQLRREGIRFIRDFLILGRVGRNSSGQKIYQRLGSLRLSSLFHGNSWFGELPERKVIIF